jgi:hypothetical protein
MMIISPSLARLAVVLAGSICAYCVMVDMTNQKDKLKNLAIIIIATSLLFLFGADLLALLLNSLGVQD